MEKIQALIIRDFRRILQWRPLIVQLLIEPVVYLLLFGVGFTTTLTKVHYAGRETPYLVFVLPGLIALQTFTQFTWQISYAANDKRWGLFRVLILSGVRPWQYAISQAVARIPGTVIQISIILLGGLLLIRPFPPIDGVGYVLIIAVILTGIFLWTAAALIIGIQVESEEKRDLLWTLLNLPIMFSSSVFYNVKEAPLYIRALSYINPLTYIADAVRASFYGSNADAFLRLGILLVACFIVWMWGLITLRQVKLVSQER